MRAPDDYVEIFLQPGEFFFGDEATRIRTVLGSCVAITIWHPARRWGGMVHYLVPSRGQRAIDTLDARYGDEAMLMLLKEAVAINTDPNEYQIKVFGGGNMFPHLNQRAAMQIGRRNIEQAKDMLRAFGLDVAAEHTGGAGHRTVILDNWSGDVWMKYSRVPDGRTQGDTK